MFKTRTIAANAPYSITHQKLNRFWLNFIALSPSFTFKLQELPPTEVPVCDKNQLNSFLSRQMGLFPHAYSSILQYKTILVGAKMANQNHNPLLFSVISKLTPLNRYYTVNESENFGRYTRYVKNFMKKRFLRLPVLYQEQSNLKLPKRK